MKRREFIASSIAMSATPLTASAMDPILSNGFELPRKPNILFILVDEMRFPMHFPMPGMTWQQFIANTMPNLWRVWSQAVSFNDHHTAATACTPSRACLMTGLYAHQHFQLTTLAPNTASQGSGLGPQLPVDYPTLGTIMADLGYSNWYFGKWHLSFSGNDPALDAGGASYLTPYTYPGSSYLSDYGFNGGCYPDPDGHTPASAAQGDPHIVDGFLRWYQQTRPSLSAPWFATVSLLNPHDMQFFWDGPFDDPTRTTRRDGTGSEWVPLDLASIPTLYQERAPNWQVQPQAGAPAVIGDTARLQDIINGAISASGDGFAVASISPPLNVPNAPTTYTIAPQSYWTRALDYYCALMTQLDGEIGRVLDAVANTDTLIVFTSDHGDFAGSHGLIGKGYSGYRESTHVPFFVYDPRGQYTGETNVPRTGLTSSVDVLPMIATLGNRGSTSWRDGNVRYAQLFGTRHNVFAMLRSASANGRSFVLQTYDEPLGTMNAAHVISLRTATGLYVGYYNWPTIGGPLPAPSSEQYFAASDVLELNNLAGSPAAISAAQQLTDLINTELRAPLPLNLQPVRAQMINRYEQYSTIVAPSNFLGIMVFNQVNW